MPQMVRSSHLSWQRSLEFPVQVGVQSFFMTLRIYAGPRYMRFFLV
jgi:hypothetical protein